MITNVSTKEEKQTQIESIKVHATTPKLQS